MEGSEGTEGSAISIYTLKGRRREERRREEDE